MTRITTCLRGVACASAVALALPTPAATVWTDWTSATNGEPGSAAGTLDGIGIAYSGEVGGATLNGSTAIWAPASSFVGGTVSTSPSTVGDALFLNGSSITSTLTFSSPIVDPVLAIWSLGSPILPASFTFDATPTLEVGGPNADWGGISITVNGNTVNGAEGSGVVSFSGTFSSLSFTSTFENFYAFTVGQSGAAGPALPEPGSWALVAAGLAALGLMSQRRRRSWAEPRRRDEHIAL